MTYRIQTKSILKTLRPGSPEGILYPSFETSHTVS